MERTSQKVKTDEILALYTCYLYFGLVLTLHLCYMTNALVFSKSDTHNFSCILFLLSLLLLLKIFITIRIKFQEQLPINFCIFVSDEMHPYQ